MKTRLYIFSMVRYYPSGGMHDYDGFIDVDSIEAIPDALVPYADQLYDKEQIQLAIVRSNGLKTFAEVFIGVLSDLTPRMYDIQARCYGDLKEVLDDYGSEGD